MILKQAEVDAITEMRTQEKNCIEKYRRYKEQAKDPVLKSLFADIEKHEQKHYDTLGQVLNGQVPSCDCNDCAGKDYEPRATYTQTEQSEDKQSDNFLATDCIGTEKLISSEYNSSVFRFSDAGVRKVLADIQVEEQNHAEMLYKYRTVNGMA